MLESLLTSNETRQTRLATSIQSLAQRREKSFSLRLFVSAAKFVFVCLESTFSLVQRSASPCVHACGQISSLLVSFFAQMLHCFLLQQQTNKPPNYFSSTVFKDFLFSMIDFFELEILLLVLDINVTRQGMVKKNHYAANFTCACIW